MKRSGFALIALGLLLLGPSALAQQPAHEVDVIELEGVIDPTSANYLGDEIGDAIERGSELIVIQLDTPGGLEVSVRDMVRRILDSPVPVVVWVGPPGARAASAGAFLVYASHVAAMAPAASLGAAHPIDLGGDLSGATGEEAVNDAARLLRSIAEERGRPVSFAERAVREGASLTSGQAQDQGVIEVVSSSMVDLLSKLDGRTVETSAGPVTLTTIASEGESVQIRNHQMGVVRGVLHGVSSPTVAFLLLTLGFWAIVFEVSQPGFGLAGVGGAIALILAAYALAVLPVDIAGLILVVLGLLLFAVDVFTQGLGVFTAGGALSFGIGGFMLFAGVSPEIRVSPWLISALILGSVLFFGFVMTAAMRTRLRRSITGQEGLVGLVGQARARLEPEGHVWVKGALWKARAVGGGAIEEGSKVRVRRVDGLLLLVQQDEDGRGEGTRVSEG